MADRHNGRRPPTGRKRKTEALDTTALYPLRQDALPTLTERRRLAREMLDRQQAELGRLIRIDPAAEAVRAVLDNIAMLRMAVDYLGAPHPRLDVYRTFALPLPPPRFTPVTPWRPLPKPPPDF